MVDKLSRLPITRRMPCGSSPVSATARSARSWRWCARVRRRHWTAIWRKRSEPDSCSLQEMPIASFTIAFKKLRIPRSPEGMRAETHLRIGRLLAAHTSPDKREETIFEMVNQLNRGAALITSRDQKEQLAELNLIAGKRANSSTAYVSALNYLVAGATLLSDDDGWNRRPDLMFALELHRAECDLSQVKWRSRSRY